MTTLSASASFDKINIYDVKQICFKTEEKFLYFLSSPKLMILQFWHSSKTVGKQSIFFPNPEWY